MPIEATPATRRAMLGAVPLGAMMLGAFAQKAAAAEMTATEKANIDTVTEFLNAFRPKDMTKALEWAGQLEKIPGMPPMVAKLWLARVQLKKGDKAAAIATAQEGVKAATDAKSDEYVRMNKEVITAAGK